MTGSYIETPLRVTVIVYVLGVCAMLPWNLLITANSYWQYKLRNTSLDEFEVAQETSLTRLQVAFMPTLVFIASFILFISGFFTSIITKWVSEKGRTLGSLFLTLGGVGVVTVLTFIDTDQWQYGFFIVTMVMVFLMNAGVGIFQASVFGMVGHLPAGCIVALMSGESLAGVVSSLSQLLSLAVGEEDPVVSGIIYFCLADVYLIVTIYAYVILTRMDFYKNAKKNEHEAGTNITLAEYMRVLKKIFWLGWSFGFVLVVTLVIFPSVQVYVTSTHPPSTWTEVYFQPTITFLLFNVMDMIGREAARWKQWPSHTGSMYHILVAARVVFIPLVLLCNGDNKSFPTLFHTDLAYIVINSLLGLTNGYFQSLALLFYPRMVSKEEIELAGTMMASLLGFGTVVGSLLGPLFVSMWGPNA